MAFVRVKGPNGSEFSIDERAVEGMRGVQVTDKPAVDINGRPLPPKPATDKAGQPKVSAPTKNDNKES